jgi:hypothetical protein
MAHVLSVCARGQAGGTGTIVAASVTATVVPVTNPTPTPTPPPPAAGFPIWAIVVIVVGGVAFLGGWGALWCAPCSVG